MHAPKAKAVIMLVMEGGPSQADTFDPKPKLTELHLKESTRVEGLATGKRFFVGSPFKSRKVGNAGIEMSEPWQFLADPEVADELCVYRGCQAASLNHPEALLHLNTGSRLGGDPGLGSWITFGLGSVNQNFPGYVVMTELALEGMTMMVVTHEMGFARKVADRVVFMDEGCIVEDRVTNDFFNNPDSDRAKDFLSKILHH